MSRHRNAERAPVDGDDLLFAGTTPRLGSVLDLSHSFAALVFQAEALAYLRHVQGSGPIRRQFFADAGPAGGSIVFKGSAGINLGAERLQRRTGRH